MNVGFTGTRSGMTDAQKATFGNVLAEFSPALFTHGDCVGADADAHQIAVQLDVPVEIRPCNFPSMRAHCEGAAVVHPITTAFTRNRAIVDSCDLLIATPVTNEEQERGGTWYTIRYARKKGRKTIIIPPDGSRP